MIGSEAASTYVFTLVIPSVFFIVGILLQTKLPQRLDPLLPETDQGRRMRAFLQGKGSRIFGAVFICMSILLLSLNGLRLNEQMQFHNRLTNLRPAEVVAIQTPRVTVTNQKDIDRIIGALRTSEWFLPDHGGWTTKVPLTVRFKSQPDLQLELAYYLRQEGVVVFAEGTRSGSTEFSADLAKALSASGLPLPIAEEDRRRYTHK